MHDLLRRLRGLISIGLTWALFWTAILVAFLTGLVLFRPQDIDPGEGPIRMAAILGGVGLVSGDAFSLLLSFAERGREVLSLSMSRAALCGILGSAAFPLLTGRQDQVFIMCPIGAAVSMALITVARKAAVRESAPSRCLRDAFFAFVLKAVRDAVGASRMNTSRTLRTQ